MTFSLDWLHYSNVKRNSIQIGFTVVMQHEIQFKLVIL